MINKTHSLVSLKITALAAFILVCFTNVFSQDGNTNSSMPNDSANYSIGNTNGAYIPEIATDKSYEVLPAELFNNKYFRLIQFYQIPSDENRQKWANEGMVLTDYLPGNIYFAVINTDFQILQIRSEIRAIFPVDSRFKMESSLYFSGIPDHAIKAGGKAEMVLSYYKTLDPESVIQDLKNNGVEIKSHREYSMQLEVSFDATRLEEIVALPYIQFMGAVPGNPVPESDNLAYRNAADRSNYINTGYNGINYNGAGVVIDIGEGGTINNTLDFHGRFTELTTGDPSDHKLGCTDNAGGAGNIDPQNRSHAWGASILSTDGENYPNLITNQNVRYFNHSYGFGIQGAYSSAARDHDLRVASYPNHVVSYSSGNVGDDPGYAPYDALSGWANITGNVKHNKNQMVVANLSPDDNILSWGCKGPAYDGRILPHIIVAGPEGTSYASPKAVGLFAQLEQAYKANNGGTESPGSLMRAIVFNTADDMGNAGPDFKTGYGRPNARRALQVITNNQVLSGSASQGNSNTHNIVVPSGTSQVRVMLVWPDVAASVNANPAIVNNLNLTATSPSSTSYNPWVLDPTPNATNLDAPATRQVDNLNTIEQITVDNPAAGTWALQVNGASIPFGPQQYFISYEFIGDELQMMYPLENERFISGDNYLLKWDSYGSAGTFTLEYQIDGGSWTTIVSNYNSASRVYSWTAPVISGIHTIKFRVKRGSLTSESGTNYFGKVADNFRIAKVCSDTVTLKWSPVAGATSYKIYKLGSMYMGEVVSNITFNGSSAVLTGQSTSSSEYYAVSTLTGSNEGQRTVAIEKVAGDYSCGAVSWTGVLSTDWFNAGNWSSGVVPSCSDDIIIPASASNQPLINTTGASCNTITIETGASLTMNSGAASKLSVCGDWINNGTFNRGLDTIDFVGTNAFQELGGSSTSNFYYLKVSKGNVNNILEVTSLITLNASANPLVINSGTFKLSSSSNLTPFTTGSGAELFSSKCVWNNGGTINYGNYIVYNAGTLRLSAGTINLGTVADNHLILWNGGSIIVEGGELNIAGALRPNSGSSVGSYTQFGGIVRVCMVGSTGTGRGAFEINSGVPFTWTGGDIIVRRHTSNTGADVIISATTNNVSGGTLQIGDAATPVSQNIRINTTVPLNHLTINAFNNPVARLVTNGLTVKNNITISGGTFNANNLNVLVGGNWTNNGTFTPGTSTVTFNGFIPQQILGSSTTAFSGLTLSNANGLTLNNSVNTQVNGVLNLTSGVITTQSNTLELGASGTVSRTSGHIFGYFQKSFTSALTALNFEIGDASESNYTPAAFSFSAISVAGSLKVGCVNADHPNILSSNLSSEKGANRYWNVVNQGISFTDYSATFNFLNQDLDASADPGTFICGKYSSSWTYPSIGTRTANSTQITGETSFSDFQLANYCSPEVCDGIDNDCDGLIDEETGTTWYQDIDGDNYGNPVVSTLACSVPVGYVSDNTDCNDEDNAINTGATEMCNADVDDDCDGLVDNADPDVTGQTAYYVDGDTDGYGAGAATLSCTAVSGSVTDNTDCDDALALVNPGAAEICNSDIDDDCDGLADNADPDITGQTAYYVDGDTDGYGAGVATLSCTAVSGSVTDNTDCNDASAAINPAATEICNSNMDDDCDNLADNDDESVTGQSIYYADNDADGYGAGAGIQSCTQPANTSTNNTDCNDVENSVNPGATEICNTIDDDCDISIDEGVTNTYYADNDADGFGAGTAIEACTQPANTSTNNTDCNDVENSVNPGATEVCNTIDDDCDTSIDEGVTNTYYADNDADGYGAGAPVMACSLAENMSANDDDCDDISAAINPGATEVCNGTDDDCDLSIDEGAPTVTYYQDADGDGKGNPLVTVDACAQPMGYVTNNTDCDDNTAVPCPRPTATATTDITDVSAIFSWTGTNCASRYRLEYRQKTTPALPWIVVYVTETSYELTGLSEGTNYQWRVGTVCTPGGTSVPAGFTLQLQFKTKYRVFPDADFDGYGSAVSSSVLVNTFPATGYSTDNTDCNDAVAATHPNATELCNGLDDDCDGTVDDGIANPLVWYQDADDDGLGNELVSLGACTQPAGYVSNSNDCDDNSNVLVCAPPTNGLASDLNATSATLSWSVVPCALRYTMQYRRILPTGAWSTKVNIDNTTTTLTGLLPNTTYQLRVRSLCPSPNPTTSDWLTITFTTTALPMGLVETTEMTDLYTAEPTVIQVAVYPNPGDGRFNLHMTSETDGEADITVMDGFGKLIQTVRWSVFEGITINELDLTHLPGGVYHINIRMGDMVQTKKVVIVR
jgi:hypothetical protein